MGKKKKKKGSGCNYFVLVPLAGVILLLLFFNLNLFNQRKVVREQFLKAQEELERISEEESYFQGQAEDDSIEEKVERIAREQLLLKKEGESVIVISRPDDVEEGEEDEEEDEENFFEKLIRILPWTD